MTLDIAQYGRKTQERIVARVQEEPRVQDHSRRGIACPMSCPVTMSARDALYQTARGTATLNRSIALTQSVREDEDRAAVAYAATLIPIGTVHSVREHRTSREAEACSDFQDHMRE